MSTRRAMSSDQGTVTVEYVMVLALVSLTAALAVKSLGPGLHELYLFQRFLILSPTL